MSSMSYKHKDTSRQADLKLFTNSNLFWGNTQLLKMPRASKSDTPLKRPKHIGLKKLGYLPNWLESLSVSLHMTIYELILQEKVNIHIRNKCVSEYNELKTCTALWLC